MYGSLQDDLPTSGTHIPEADLTGNSFKEVVGAKGRHGFAVRGERDHRCAAEKGSGRRQASRQTTGLEIPQPRRLGVSAPADQEAAIRRERERLDVAPLAGGEGTLSEGPGIEPADRAFHVSIE